MSCNIRCCYGFYFDPITCIVICGMMGGVCNLNSSQIDIDNDVTVELFEIDPDSLIMILTEFTIISSSKQYCNCNSIWTGGG